MYVQRKIDELLALRASEWLELLPTATEAQRGEFAQWLGESRLHIEAFLEIAEIELALHRVDRARSHDLEVLLSRVAPNVVPLGRPPPGTALEKRSKVPRQAAWRSRVWLLSGAFAACACVAAVALLILQTRAPEFSTEIGEQKTVGLADASIVTLNALSEVTVHLEDTARDIELRQGEALFDVAHDARRPFKVHTRAGTMQAVGTQFNVYDRPDGDTRVSVLEGRVLVTARAGMGTAGEPRSQLLEAGQEADIRLDGTIVQKVGAVVSNTVAWRERRLVFEEDGLEDMVLEFNRYNRSIRLRLENVPPHLYRYTGVFDADDPESFVSLLAREPDLEVARNGAEVIVRYRGEGTTL